jgi:hypothetical protein
LEDFQAFLWSVLGAGGGGAAVAYLAFKGLGESWLESKFAEKLEAFRHEKLVELARMRVEIDSSLDSALRLQEKRFNAMSEAWTLLQEAYGASIAFVSPMQSYADLRRHDDKEIEEVMNLYELTPMSKRAILKSSDRQKDFQDAIDRKLMNEMNNAISAFNNAIHLNAIFFREDDFQELMEINKQLSEIHRNKSFRLRHGGGSILVDEKEDNAWDELTGSVKDRVEKLGEKFRRSLGSNSSN